MNRSDVNVVPSQQVFVNQTAAIVYSHPSSEAEILLRLDKGRPLLLFPSNEDTGTQWLPARMASGQDGYIRANTKTVTREELVTERAKIRWGYTLGRGKMVMGGGILLFGLATVIAPLVMSAKHEGTFVMYYGAIAAGGGESVGAGR